MELHLDELTKVYTRYLRGMRVIARVRPIRLAYTFGHFWTKLFSPRLTEMQQVMDKMNGSERYLPFTKTRAWADYLWHASANTLNTYMYSAMDKRWLGSNVRIIGQEHIQTASESGAGTLILTAHQHSMMMLAVTAGLFGKQMHPILMNPELTVPDFLTDYADKAVQTSSAHYNGGSYILVDYHSTYVRPVYRALQSGGVVLSANDFPESLAPKRRKILPFLGRKISCPTGSVEIAMQCHARIVPAFIYKTDGVLVAHFYPPLSGTLDEIMLSYAGLLEQCVQKDPGAWEGWKWPDIFEN